MSIYKGMSVLSSWMLAIWWLYRFLLGLLKWSLPFEHKILLKNTGRNLGTNSAWSFGSTWCLGGILIIPHMVDETTILASQFMLNILVTPTISYYLALSPKLPNFLAQPLIYLIHGHKISHGKQIGKKYWCFPTWHSTWLPAARVEDPVCWYVGWELSWGWHVCGCTPVNEVKKKYQVIIYFRQCSRFWLSKMWKAWVGTVFHLKCLSEYTASGKDPRLIAFLYHGW